MHVDEDGGVGSMAARDLEASLGKVGHFSDFSRMMRLEENAGFDRGWSAEVSAVK